MGQKQSKLNAEKCKVKLAKLDAAYEWAKVRHWRLVNGRKQQRRIASHWAQMEQLKARRKLLESDLNGELVTNGDALRQKKKYTHNLPVIPELSESEATVEPELEYSSSVHINQLSHEEMLHLFKNHFSLEELFPLTDVCLYWRYLVKQECDRHNQMTIQVSAKSGDANSDGEEEMDENLWTKARCSDDSDSFTSWPLDNNKDPLLQEQIFYLTDIVSSFRKVENGETIYPESIGTEMPLDADQVNFTFVRQMSCSLSHSLTSLIIYWEVPMVNSAHYYNNALIQMINSLVQLTRFSIWFAQTYDTAPRATNWFIKQLCATLNAHPSINWLDLNFLRLSLDATLDLSGIMQRLERLTLGLVESHHLDISQILAPAGPALKHLRLEEMRVCQFKKIAPLNNGALAAGITHLALRTDNIRYHTLVSYFRNLQSLTIDADFPHHKQFIDHNLILALRTLNHLTELTLIGFELLPDQEPSQFCLSRVTKLTLVGKKQQELFTNFCIIPDLLDIPKLGQSLFSHFPRLKELTLIGNLHPHLVVEKQLREEWIPPLEILNLYLRDKTVSVGAQNKSCLKEVADFNEMIIDF